MKRGMVKERVVMSGEVSVGGYINRTYHAYMCTILIAFSSIPDIVVYIIFSSFRHRPRP